MIDSRILTTLKSRNENPGYSILITGYDNSEDCNQEKLVIHLHQINKSLNELENLEGAVILSKDLTIESNMDYDSINNAIKTTLIGYSNYNGAIPKPNLSEGDLLNYYIEMVDTELKDIIKIEFNRNYSKMPQIIPTIDKKYKSYYKSYDTEFIVKNNLYTGVIITFNKLKRKKIYPNINFTIIGDAVQRNTVIDTNAVTITYGNTSTKLKAVLKDIYGNPIDNASVKFVVGNVTKTITTSASGQASLSLNTVNVGNHTATISYSGNNKYNETSTTVKVTVKKIETSITSNNVTVAQGDGAGKLVAELKDANNNAIKNANIVVTLNNSTQTKTTDDNGKIYVDTKNLSVGRYSVGLDYGGNNYYNNSHKTATITVR